MTAKETVIVGHDATTSGKTTAGTILRVGGKAISTIRRLRVTLEVTRAIIGTSPTLDIFLQRPIVEDFDEGVEPDWEDFFAFTQLDDNDAVGARFVVDLPLPSPQDVDGSLANQDRVPAQETLTARALLAGHWGDAIRVRTSQ